MTSNLVRGVNMNLMPRIFDYFYTLHSTMLLFIGGPEIIVILLFLFGLFFILKRTLTRIIELDENFNDIWRGENEMLDIYYLSIFLLSIILVAIILFIGLGSLKIVLACLTTLLLGLIITTAFATFAIGRLNLISIAFAVLYIGLGIDFAIHMALRFKEESNVSSDYSDRFRKTIKHISKPLILCAVTTAIGFYAFIPTNYQGVAELGWIAGTGMIISLILTFTLLPALLTYIPSHTFENKKKITKNYFMTKIWWMWILRSLTF